MDRKPTRSRFRRVGRWGFVGTLAAPVLSLGVYADPFYEPPRVADVQVEERVSGGLRVLSLNVAHGRGKAFNQVFTRPRHIRQNLDAIARLIRAADADVVALQELDAPSLWSGGLDHMAYLAEQTGYGHTFHGLHVDRLRPRLAYGTGVLSRFPIAHGSSFAFGRNALDTKGFVRAQIVAPGGAIDVVSVHLDFKRDSERRAQLAVMGEHLLGRPDPAPHLVVAGDFNCSIDGRDGHLFWFVESQALSVAEEQGPGTFPAGRPSRHIDYVLISDGLEFAARRVLSVQVSDHLPVLAEVRARP